MDWLEKAQQLYLEFGYTTVQDGRSDAGAIASAMAAAESRRLVIDVVSYPDILQLGDGALANKLKFSRSYTNRFRIGGVKLTLDGSPQGKTAWLTEPYLVPPDGQKAGYRGYGVLAMPGPTSRWPRPSTTAGRFWCMATAMRRSTSSSPPCVPAAPWSRRVPYVRC
jgi:hypothetical protein